MNSPAYSNDRGRVAAESLGSVVAAEVPPIRGVLNELEKLMARLQDSVGHLESRTECLCASRPCDLPDKAPTNERPGSVLEELVQRSRAIDRIVGRIEIVLQTLQI